MDKTKNTSAKGGIIPNIILPNVTDMTIRRKQIEGIYDGDAGLRTLTRGQIARMSGAEFGKNKLENILTSLNRGQVDSKQVIEFSNFAYATEPFYTEMIDYLSNMFLWRYYFIPVQVKESKSGKINPKEYAEMYDEMANVVEGINIENIFPMLLAKLYREGVIYLYVDKNTSSKTVSTILLDPLYCSPLMKSQYGTGIYRFDLQYFDKLGLKGEQLDEALQLFPRSLVKLYESYKKDGVQDRYAIIDGRIGGYVSSNDLNFPQKITSLRNIFDYHGYRINEIERSNSSLEKIVVHKIPIYEDRPVFEIPEVKSLHSTMSKIINKSDKVRLITTFGDTSLLHLQETGRVQDNVLEKSSKSVYQGNGLNTEIFFGNNQESLRLSVLKDTANVWQYVEQLINFYNLAINNLYNFKNYQVELAMLPMTHYSAEKDLEKYRKNAEFGVGKLELIVASGTKQKHIDSKAQLEEFLNLENILKPLKSAHTQTADSGDKETDPKNKETETEDKENDPKEPEKEDDDKSEMVVRGGL